jgi:hypothetical protein
MVIWLPFALPNDLGTLQRSRRGPGQPGADTQKTANRAPTHGYEATREAAMAGVVVRPLRRRDVRIAVLGFRYGLNLRRRVSDGKALTDIPALFDSGITEF